MHQIGNRYFDAKSQSMNTVVYTFLENTEFEKCI